MEDKEKVRVAARQQATELTAEDISAVSGGNGTISSSGKCRDRRYVGVVICEDWNTD